MKIFFREIMLICFILGSAVSAYAGNQGLVSEAKKPICGMVSMGDMSFLNTTQLPTNNFEELNGNPMIYAAVVIIATWSQLEPNENEFDFSVIDKAISNIGAYNKKYPQNPVVGKLRIFGGSEAPAWAKAIDGGPFTLTDGFKNLQMGHFWNATYQAEWRKLQNQLATTYDSNSLVGEVAISSCSSITAEPFVYPNAHKEASQLLKAGFTDDQMQSCLNAALDDYAGWSQTPLDYTFNPYIKVGSGNAVHDDAFEVSVMTSFRARYGEAGVIANHALQDPIKSTEKTLYNKILSLGGSVEFRAVSPTINVLSAFDFGLGTYKATELETWDTKSNGGPVKLTSLQLQQLASQFICP